MTNLQDIQEQEDFFKYTDILKKQYAEQYAIKCIECLLGGRCMIANRKTLVHTSSDNSLRVQTDLPEHI